MDSIILYENGMPVCFIPDFPKSDLVGVPKKVDEFIKFLKENLRDELKGTVPSFVIGTNLWEHLDFSE